MKQLPDTAAQFLLDLVFAKTKKEQRRILARYSRWLYHTHQALKAARKLDRRKRTR